MTTAPAAAVRLYAVAVVTDLKRAYEALAAKQRPLSTLFDYYDGIQPLRYSATRLAQAFASLDASFSENWCATVVDSLTDRLDLRGLTTDGAGQEQLDALWTAEQLAMQSDDVAEDVAVTGESYVIVGRDADGGVSVIHNDPRVCCVFYDDADPRRKAFAAKWYVAADAVGTSRRHMTLYYEDRFEHYTSNVAADHVSDASAFVMDDGSPEMREDSGQIPVFHVQVRTRRQYGQMQNALRIQDALNKTVADMMVTAEYGAFRQRYVISQADVSDLRNAPNEIWKIPAGDSESEGTKVGQFEASDLENYLKVIDHFANAMARVTRTPAHFFFAVGAGVSGDALIAAESPLAKNAAKYKERLDAFWSEVGVYALELAGVAASGVRGSWADERTVQPVSESQVTTQLVAAGVPLRTALRRAGWTDAELNAMDEDAASAATSQASLAQQMLSAARARFDAGQTNPTQA